MIINNNYLRFWVVTINCNYTKYCVVISHYVHKILSCNYYDFTKNIWTIELWCESGNSFNSAFINDKSCNVLNVQEFISYIFRCTLPWTKARSQESFGYISKTSMNNYSTSLTLTNTIKRIISYLECVTVE